MLLYLVLKPIYIWRSGLPQVSDFVVAALVIFVALRRKSSPSPRSVGIRPFLPFVAIAYYFTLVNLVAMLVTSGDGDFLAASAFHIFNVAVGVTIGVLHSELGPVLRRWIFYGVVTSVLVQALLLAFQGSSQFRETGQFNNPNQLAYYGLLSACLIVFAALKDKVSTLWVVLGITAAAWLVLSSLSKAAIIAMGVLIAGVILVASTNAGKGLRRTSWVVAGGLILLFSHNRASDGIRSSDLYERLEARFGIRQSDDSLAGRGYDRIWDNPQTWLFGAGEGGYDRFGGGIELHSTIGTIQFAYGVVGTVLFSILLILAVRKCSWIGLLILVPIMLFGLSHNGLRNTLLWILLSLMLSFRTGRPHPQFTSIEEAIGCVADDS